MSVVLRRYIRHLARDLRDTLTEVWNAPAEARRLRVEIAFLAGRIDALESRVAGLKDASAALRSVARGKFN